MSSLGGRAHFWFGLAIFGALLVAVASESQAKNTSLTRQLRQTTPANGNTTADKQSIAQQDKENEIDDRIYVTEPYKSLIQTSARFALAQTKISNHVNLDTAMDLLNKAGYLLSKTSTLIRAIKTIAISIATLVATTFVFPGTYRHLEALWNDPINTLNLDRYLANGMSDSSVIGMLSLRTDEALSRVGLNDYSCRKRSICYMGEILRCSFPASAETLIEFSKKHFSGSNYRESKYLKGFISGFVDRNCSAIDVDPSSEHSCFNKILNSVLSPQPRASHRK